MQRAPRLLLRLAFLLFLSTNSAALALNVPPLRGRVNDLARILSSDKAQELEERLKNFEQETGHQIAVLTIPSLAGDNLEEFSIRVAEAWKIGQKKLDNGAILLWAQKEKKIRIEVGRGFEGIMPDAVASWIIREVIAPRTREGDYGGGIEAGVESIMSVTRAEDLPKPKQTRIKPRSISPGAALGGVVFAALVALLIGISQSTPLRGAFKGAIGAGVIGIPAWWWLSSSVFGILVLLTGAIVGAGANLYATAAWGKPWTGGRSGRGRERWPRDAAIGGSGWYGGGYGGDFGGGGFGDMFGGMFE